MSTSNKLRALVISSTAGGVFREMYKLNKFADFYVITDRKCDIEKFCKENSIPIKRIEIKNNDVFSRRVNDYIKNIGGVDFILLFFTRLVGQDIYKNYPTFNIHPSLLPAFKGFNPIRQAIRAKVKFLGATLHQVDKNIDGGQIVAQVVNPIKIFNENYLNKLSFLQKTLLSFLLVDFFISKDIVIVNNKISITRKSHSGKSYNPCPNNKLILGIFRSLERKRRALVL